MKLIRPLFYFCVGIICLTLAFALPDLYSLIPLSGDVVLAGGYLAKIADDPQLWHKWDKLAQKQGELKTEFREEEIGTVWGDDGPEPSQRVPTSPIVKKTDLENGGKYMDVPINNPLFTDAFDILNAGRFGEQDRIGGEETLTRHNFRVLLDKWHLGIAEKEVEESIPNTAHMTPEKMLKRMVDAWTDNKAQRDDYGVWFTAIAGHDIHHFIAASERGNKADGTVPVSEPNMGLMSAPTEHKRLFVWRPGTVGNVMAQVSFNATPATYEASIVTELDKIDETATPGIKLFKAINRECLRSAMIPARLKDPDGRMREYYLVYVPGALRDLAEEDEKFEKVVNSAYQGMVDKHPLLRTGDILYKNLIIRESTKLEKADEFTAEGQYNSIPADTTESTRILFNRSGSGAQEKLSITPGTRSATAAGAFDTAFSSTSLTRVGRIFVFGGAAICQAVGKSFPLQKLEITEQGLKDGIGKTVMRGCVRNEKWDTDNTYASTPQSFEVLCLMDLQ